MTLRTNSVQLSLCLLLPGSSIRESMDWLLPDNPSWKKRAGQMWVDGPGLAGGEVYEWPRAAGGGVAAYAAMSLVVGRKTLLWDFHGDDKRVSPMLRLFLNTISKGWSCTCRMTCIPHTCSLSSHEWKLGLITECSSALTMLEWFFTNLELFYVFWLSTVCYYLWYT